LEGSGARDVHEDGDLARVAPGERDERAVLSWFVVAWVCVGGGWDWAYKADAVAAKQQTGLRIIQSLTFLPYPRLLTWPSSVFPLGSAINKDAPGAG